MGLAVVSIAALAGVAASFGVVDRGAVAHAVTAGQVGASTDTGRSGAAMQSAWANGHPERVRDYGRRRHPPDGGHGQEAHHRLLWPRRRQARDQSTAVSLAGEA